jgi:hypothetical protein
MNTIVRGLLAGLTGTAAMALSSTVVYATASGVSYELLDGRR